MEGYLVVTGVEFDEQITLFDVLVVVHPDLGHQPGNPGADLMHVAGGVGVVGAFVCFLVVQEGQEPDDEQGEQDQRDEDAERRGDKSLGFARLFVFVVAFLLVFAVAFLLVFAAVLFPSLVFFLFIALLLCKGVLLLQSGGDPIQFLAETVRFARQVLSG